MEPVTKGLSALVVEDDVATNKAVVSLAESEGFAANSAMTMADARASLKDRRPTIVLSDLVLPDGNGLDLLDCAEGVDLVFMTGQATVETVVSALRRGALDYLVKPVEVTRLRQILRDVARAHGGAALDAPTVAEAEAEGSFGRLIGRSKPMLKLYEQIRRVAPTLATVLVQGETGTGKELVARTIHELSDRRDEAFVPLNCGAVSVSLIESELFGHEKGSFTGANRRHLGVFERAHGGTLFLDEITEMPLELQVKLLRVLESRSFQRVGGEAAIESHARLIAATNRTPEEAVRSGKLREDLFYRLRVFPIFLSPLGKRGDDVPLLARHFLESLGAAEGRKKTFTPEACEWLAAQSWPGNVRELRNLVERAYILADDTIGVEDLTVIEEEDGSDAPPTDEVRIPLGTSLQSAEKELILATLRRFKGDKPKTARVLGISLKTLYTRLAAWRGSE